MNKDILIVALIVVGMVFAFFWSRAKQKIKNQKALIKQLSGHNKEVKSVNDERLEAVVYQRDKFRKALLCLYDMVPEILRCKDLFLVDEEGDSSLQKAQKIDFRKMIENILFHIRESGVK